MNKRSAKPLSLLLILLLLFGVSSCAKGSKAVVYAQSVAVMSGYCLPENGDRFPGVAVAGNVQKVFADETMTVKELLVQVGSTVNAGDVLFTYDDAAAKLSVEQKKLELEGMKNTVVSLNAQIADLTKERATVSDSEKLRYTLEIQGLEADVRETEYKIGLKEKEIASAEDALADTGVKALLSGVVTEIHENGGTDDMGEAQPLVVITETGKLRIKGQLNELSRGLISEGAAVRILSRTDDTVWTGTVEKIDWENPIKNNGYYGGEDEMSSSSKYPFYVTVNEGADLMIGRHVYIEPGQGLSDSTQVRLLAGMTFEEDGRTFVWAAKDDKLEKREVTIAGTDEFTGDILIASGLTTDDYVAWPAAELKAGLPVEKVDFLPEEDEEETPEENFENFENFEDFGDDGMDIDGAADGDAPVLAD